MEKDWVVLKLGFRKVWVVLKLGFRVALRGPEFRAWILTLESKISGVEKLGSTSVFLLSEFTGVAWKPVVELYWVMLECVLNDPAVPLRPLLPWNYSPWNATW